MESTIKGFKEIQKTLMAVYGIVPIVAGLDKFTNLLTDWAHYLSPSVIHLLPVSTHAFMMMVGIIEIIAGILVFAVPRVGAVIVGIWLALIAINLIIGGNYLDVAVRDIAMCVASFMLALDDTSAATGKSYRKCFNATCIIKSKADPCKNTGE